MMDFVRLRPPSESSVVVHRTFQAASFRLQIPLQLSSGYICIFKLDLLKFLNI